MKTWVERLLYSMDFAVSSLSRRKTKNSVLVVCFSMVLFLSTSVMFFSRSLRHEVAALLESSPAVLVQRELAGRYAPIAMDYSEKINAIPGVRYVDARLWGYYFHRDAGANYTVMVARKERIPEGKAKVGLGVLRTWGIDRGDTMRFRAFDGASAELEAEQAFGADTELFTADMILVSEAAFRTIFGFPENLFTDLVLSVQDSADLRKIAEEIEHIAPETRAITRDEILRSYRDIFDWRTGFVMILLSSAMLAFAFLAVDKALCASAVESCEIEVLKSVGWDRADILWAKFWEGFAVSFCAFLIGVVFAYFHVFFFSAPLFEHALKGWSILYPKFRFAPVFSALDLGAAFVFSVVPYSLASVAGARKEAGESQKVEEAADGPSKDEGIELVEVCKTYNLGTPSEFQALRDVSLSLALRKCTVFKGPRGAGKTTLLRLIAGMERPSSGAIRFKGADIGGLDQRSRNTIRRKSFGFVFEDFRLIEQASVLENIMIPAYPTGRPAGEVRRRAEGLLERLRLIDKATEKVENIDRRERLRTAVARALINEPEILVADDPTAHLDKKLAAEFLEIAKEFLEEGKTILIASNDPLVCEAEMVGRVLELRDGRVFADRSLG